MKYVARIAPLAFLLMPALALAAAPATFQDLASLIVTMLNSATGVLLTLALVVYFWGIASGLFGSKGEADYGRLRRFISWGIAIIFVMVSIWGIVQLLQNSLFSGNQFDPTNGTSGGPGVCDSFGNCSE